MDMSVWENGIAVGSITTLLLLVVWIVRHFVVQSTKREEALTESVKMFSKWIGQVNITMERHGELLEKQAEIIKEQSLVIKDISKQIESMGEVVSKLKEEMYDFKRYCDMHSIERKTSAK